MPALTTANLVAYAVQLAAIVAIGAGLPVVLRLTSPRARLFYWRALLLVCFVLPLVQPLASPPAPVAPTAGTASIEISAASSALRAAPASSAPAPSRPWPVGQIAAAAIAIGIAVRLVWLALGLVTLRRLRRRAAALIPRPAAIDAASLLTGAQAEFRVTTAVVRPVTFGAVRAIVVVPEEFRAFDERQQTAVACHELVHVRRHDWLRTIGDEVIRSLFWFHPALWWLLDQIHLASEQVVDQEVVAATGARQPYLDALLRFAASSPRLSLRPAALFVRRSHLRERVTLLLKEVSMSRPRLVVSFLVMAVVLVVSGRLVVSAFPLERSPAAPSAVSAGVPAHSPAIQAAERSRVERAATQIKEAPGPQGGQIVGSKRPGETTGQPAPRASTSTPARIHNVRPVYPADALRAGIRGSAVLKVTVDGAGQVSDVQVLSGDTEFSRAAVDAVRQWRYEAPQTAPFITIVGLGFTPASATAATTEQPLRIGANIKAPTKLKHVLPAYPPDAVEERVQGVVIVEAAIDPSGAVSEARVLRSIPKLDAAALDAVMQWEFSQTLLNGAPVPVIMTVTVSFRLDGQSVTEGVAGGVAGGRGGVAGGVAGGVPGGVAGGVVGGVVGGVAGGVAGGGATGTLQAPVRVGGNIAAPTKIKDVQAVYPDEARAARLAGVVIVEILVGVDGKVQDAKILRSIPQFDQAALDAVKQWEYSTTTMNGTPVPVIMTVTVNFRPE